MIERAAWLLMDEVGLQLKDGMVTEYAYAVGELDFAHPLGVSGDGMSELDGDPNVEIWEDYSCEDKWQGDFDSDGDDGCYPW